MSARPDRVHLLCHANPLGPDLVPLGMADAREYVTFARAHLPRGYRLTYDLRILTATEDAAHGGRRDDGRRIRDLQGAINDPRTLAIVAAHGGAYFSRILPHVDFSALARRREPLWATGFSEMSTLVGVIASFRCGRGLYWLGPNWAARRQASGATTEGDSGVETQHAEFGPRNLEAARGSATARRRPAGKGVAQAVLGEFWRTLPDVVAGRTPAGAEYLKFGPIIGALVAGTITGPLVPSPARPRDFAPREATAGGVNAPAERSRRSPAPTEQAGGSAFAKRSARAERRPHLPRSGQVPAADNPPAARVPGVHCGPHRGEKQPPAAETCRIRLVGGCLAVLAAATGGYVGRRLRPRGSPGRGLGSCPWLFLEDIKETPYRIDRHLASLKHAGWFNHISGLLLGDFHAMNNDTQRATLELLRYHLPANRNVPIVTTRSIGHVWPMVPVLLNRPVRLEVSGSAVRIWAWPGRSVQP